MPSCADASASVRPSHTGSRSGWRSWSSTAAAGEDVGAADEVGLEVAPQHEHLEAVAPGSSTGPSRATGAVADQHDGGGVAQRHVVHGPSSGGGPSVWDEQEGRCVGRAVRARWDRRRRRGRRRSSADPAAEPPLGRGRNTANRAGPGRCDAGPGSAPAGAAGLGPAGAGAAARGSPVTNPGTIISSPPTRISTPLTTSAVGISPWRQLGLHPAQHARDPRPSSARPRPGTGPGRAPRWAARRSRRRPATRT